MKLDAGQDPRVQPNPQAPAKSTTLKRDIAVLALGVLVLFYLCTAMVFGEGGPGAELVFHPFHGIVPFYGGGEEGSWLRHHPNEPIPWWMNRQYKHLAYFDDEGGPALGMVVYDAGYYTAVLGTAALITYTVVRALRPRRRPPAPAE